jgi:spore coat protein A, manganese oxidase
MTIKIRSIWAILALVLFVGTTGAFAQPLLDPSTLTKYVDPLLQPAVRTPGSMLSGFPLYDVHLRQAKQKMHAQLDSTTVFTFDGGTPGSTFLVQRDHPIYVRYINDLPQHHVLPVDTTIAIMSGRGWGDKSRFVAHLHGGDTPSAFDGWCESTIDPGQQTTYWYPNSQEAATLWYHDHSCGITRLNAYAGIAGFYIIIDPYERSLNMPEGAYELGIAVQDRQFYADGGLYYPALWEPEHFGDVALVNGKIWPKLEVEPRKYRIHLLDGCNDRFISIKLIESDTLGVVPPESLPGPAFYMVGTEQGLVSNTVVLNDPMNPAAPRLLIGPGDRRDVIIDFAGQQGKSFLMHNNASAPFKGVFPPNPENPLPELFLVHVKDTSVVDPYTIPMQPRLQPVYDPNAAALSRDVVMEEMADSLGNPIMVLLNGMGFMDPTSEFPLLGTTEIWKYINTTMDMHPMHMHLVNFQILDKQPFNVDQYMMTHEIVFTGPAEAPDSQEVGRRDMVNCPPGYVTRVVTSPFNRLGRYVYHCHILAHEENDMMRPFEVVDWQGVSGQDGEIALDPYAVQLRASVPNPFRDRTTVSFSLPYKQAVRLGVYSVLGQEVKTLAAGAIDAGVHSFAWDGTDASGRRVAAGIYLYKLVTESDTKTGRVTVVR